MMEDCKFEMTDLTVEAGGKIKTVWSSWMPSFRKLDDASSVAVAFVPSLFFSPLFPSSFSFSPLSSSSLFLIFFFPQTLFLFLGGG